MERNVPPEYAERIHKFAQEWLFHLEQNRKVPAEKYHSPISFTNVIRKIMYVFGDCKKPLVDTCLCMEKILKSQMNLILSKSSETAIKRKSDEIEPQDLLFLLRKNKVKMKRLLTYLSIKDTKELISKTNSTKHLEIVSNPTVGKRMKSYLQFLTSIDESFANIMKRDIPDPLLQKRNERKWLMTKSMSDAEYLEFSDIAGTSFSVPRGGTEDFLIWLLEDAITGLVPNYYALEILNYFARETIAEVIDLVKTAREKKESVVEAEMECGDFAEVQNLYFERDSNSKKHITVAEIEEIMLQFTPPSSSKRSLLMKLYNMNASRIICT